MTLTQRLSEYIRACFTGIWITSHEHEDAIAEIAALCRREDWRLATWDIDQGLTIAGQSANSEEAGGQDPLAAIRSLNALATPEGTALLVLQNFHRFLQSAEIVQTLVRQITAGKQNRTFVVVLAPVVQIPARTGKAVRLHRPRTAGPRATGADRPGDSHRRRRTTGRTGTRSSARRSGWLDTVRGRRSVQPVARAAWAAGTVRNLGIEVPGTREERPVVAASRRRDVHRTGRARFAQGILFAGNAASVRKVPKRSGPGRLVAGGAGDRQESRFAKG